MLITAPVSEFVFKGPLRTSEATIRKKMNDAHVKTVNQKMREAPTDSRKENDLDCNQIEINTYTEALSKIPCSSEVNVEIDDPNASLNKHDPLYPMFQDGREFDLNYSNILETPTDLMVIHNKDMGGLMARTDC